MNLPKLSTYGGLKQGDLYVERPADRTLLAALLGGDYAYVLSSRQTGKTSLMVRTFNKLREAGCRCVKVDLGSMGTDVEPSQWYMGLAMEIAEAVGCDESFVETHFASSQRRTTVQRFTRFLRALVAQSPQPLIIFVDEIEGFLKLPMRVTDDFLAAIRSCYNDRDREPAYQRLSFCLLGVCTPAELIRDERRTPFNVARGIDLTDFAWEEVRAGFLPVLGDGGTEAEEALRLIYSWSGGHPYLTHRMVQEAQQRYLSGEALTPALVEQIVRDLFLGNLGREQENFLEVERRLCLGQAHRVHRRLALYKSILAGERVVARGQDLVQLELRLTGLVREVRAAGDEPHLAVRNRIFASVYDAAWSPKIDPAKLDPALWMKGHIERWSDLGKKDAFVLRGEELLEARRWADEQPALDSTCREFLDASSRVDDHERTIRINSLLAPTLLASAVNFLLPLILHDYCRYRNYPLQAYSEYLYAIPFLLSLPSGILADKLRVNSFRVLWGGLSFISSGILLLLLDLFFGQYGLLLTAVFVILVGQTLQRPHHAVLYGLLYPRGDRRMDRAFMLFYFVINIGALIGPMLGAAMFREYSWKGTICIALAGSCLSWVSLLLSRSILDSANFPLRSESPETTALSQQRRSAIFRLTATMLIFWCSFNLIGSLFLPELTANRSQTADLTTGNLLMQGVSSGSITPLFVLLLAPVLMLMSYLLQRLGISLSAPLKIAGGMILLSGLMLHILASSHGGGSILTEYFILTLAELLVVPISMALTTALSSTKTLSSMMGGYYLVVGIGAWLEVPSSTSSTKIVLALAVTCAVIGATFGLRRRQWSEISPAPPRGAAG